MLVDAGTGTDGGSSYLNDGLGANASTISSISISSASSASDALEIIDRAIQDVSSERASLGAVSNRLDHTISNLGNVVVNTEASQSRIEDADFAKVTGDLTKAQIMSQAATAMLAQANASKQGVLSLLQG
jgi:flagellin